MSSTMPVRLPLAAALHSPVPAFTTLLHPASRLPLHQAYRNPPSTKPPSSRPSSRPFTTTRPSPSAHSPLSDLTSTTRKPITIPHLHSLHRKRIPITVLTAHDFPSAHVADAAGIDVVLVGDSLAMVALGMDSTTSLTLDDMVLHARAVARGARAAFVVADLPMGCYEVSPRQAVASAIRLVKEGHCGAVKLEGGATMAPTIRAVVDAGIPVMAHVGLTPQRSSALGGFRVQGKTSGGAMAFLRDALAVQEAGAFAVVVEAVPAEVAAFVAGKLRIPTIGIGAGAGTSGQVLVQVDMSGNFPPGRRLPKFVKQYGNVWAESLKAIEAYRDDVRSRAYPAEEHTYPIKEEELAAFKSAVVVAEMDKRAETGLVGERV